MAFPKDLEPLLELSDADLWGRGLPRSDVHVVIAERERRASLLRQWAECCPPAYRTSDWSHPELLPYRHAIEAALAWCPGKNGKPGLLLLGRPGVGKTRVMYALARRAFLEDHQIVRIVAAKELAEAALAAERDGRFCNWIAQLGRGRPLYLDDVGQERSPWPATDAWIVTMWRQLLDHAIGHGTPIVVTTNLHSADWAGRARDGYLGDAVARRLADTCTVIDFNKAQ
jgi:DNA replication protein DnaC